MTGEFNIAVHALVYLLHTKKQMTSEALANNICTNAARVRKVLSKLKKFGFIETKEGIDGGYLLPEYASQITLRQVCEALSISFVTVNWKSGDLDKKCLISSGMAGVMDDLYSQMDGICKQYLEGITLAYVEKVLFEKRWN